MADHGDIDKELLMPRDFAFCSFAFAAITGFCIGGTAIANIVGIGYNHKIYSLKTAVLLS